MCNFQTTTITQFVNMDEYQRVLVWENPQQICWIKSLFYTGMKQYKYHYISLQADFEGDISVDRVRKIIIF